MDGLEFCRRVQELPHGTRTRVLVISGCLTPHYVANMRDAGVDEYLDKPVTSAHFVNRVLALLQIGGDAL